jgi:predicted lipoprotein with Yx(FWY)xxD motif
LANYKVIATIFVVLTVIFAATTGILFASPIKVNSTQTSIQTSVQTSTLTLTNTQTSTQTVTTQTGPSSNTIDLAYKSTLGAYLTNGSGWTLYLFAKDTPNNGTSACYGGCAKTWPPFYAANLNLTPGLNASSFGTITRTDGSKQLTYNGWPLYHFAPDKAAGQTNGQGIVGLWYVVSPTTQSAGRLAGSPQLSIGVSYKSTIGAYLTNGTGWTLYIFLKDTPNNGTSACNGKCAATWPPFYAANLQVPAGLNASLFGTITRTDGTKQTTYDGWPLYHFAPDKAAGQTNGQGVGSVWYAWSLPVPSQTTSTSSTTTTTSASSTHTTSTSTSASGP